MTVRSPENLRDGAEIAPERQALLRQSARPAVARLLSFETPWVCCQYPTAAGAQAAGMCLEAFAELVYGATLLDLDALKERLPHVAARFDATDRVRVVGDRTDVSFSLAGRRGGIDDGTGANVPGGEVFYSPVEDSADGV